VLLPQCQPAQHRLLLGDQLPYPLPRQAQHLRQLRIVEHLMLGCRLHFYHLIAGGHDEVHVNVGARVLFVTEIEQDLAVDHSDAYRSDEVFQGNGTQSSGLNKFFQREP
jgi:hypothetical protein